MKSAHRLLRSFVVGASLRGIGHATPLCPRNYNQLRRPLVILKQSKAFSYVRDVVQPYHESGKVANVTYGSRNRLSLLHGEIYGVANANKIKGMRKVNIHCGIFNMRLLKWLCCDLCEVKHKESWKYIFKRKVVTERQSDESLDLTKRQKRSKIQRIIRKRLLQKNQPIFSREDRV